MLTNKRRHAHLPCWVDLATPDPQASKRFYQGLFEWTYRNVPGDHSEPYTMCQLQQHYVAGLFLDHSTQAHQPLRAQWQTYFTVKDIERSVLLVEQNGGHIDLGPRSMMGEGWIAMVSDPSGASFALWQHMTTRPASFDAAGTKTWFELQCTDSDHLAAFYASVFQWESLSIEVSGAQYKMLCSQKESSQPIAGLTTTRDQSKPWNQPKPADRDNASRWEVYFRVDDCDIAAQRISQHNGKIIRPPTDFAPLGRRATALDPQGAVFSILQWSRFQEISDVS